MDLYLYGLRTEAAQELRDAEGVQLFQAPATSLSLVLNPAPAPEGKLNPFSIPEVRTAMQYLVDRDFIAQDIYQGLAQPMITQVSPSDFDFLTVYDIDRGSGIRYDPEYARQQIADAMTAAGAELVDGTWTIGGEPIRLKFIARVEDERREIGDLVRAGAGGGRLRGRHRLPVVRAGGAVGLLHRPAGVRVAPLHGGLEPRRRPALRRRHASTP